MKRPREPRIVHEAKIPVEHNHDLGIAGSEATRRDGGQLDPTDDEIVRTLGQK
jgi:hypothetical protein